LVLIPIIVGLITGSLLLSASNMPDYFSIINIILNIAFLIILLMSMRGFSQYYDDTSIYQNSLYAVVVGIIAIIISPIMLYFVGLSPSILSVTFSYIIATFFGILVGFFYRNAFYALSEKSGEEHFRHAGWLIFIGGILTIIVIGVFVVLLGRIFAVLAFKSMKPKLTPNPTQ
jgi:uncharacterized membrane protein